MLRTAPIRSKVIAVLVVPLVGLLVLAAAGIGTTLARGAEAHRVTTWPNSRSGATRWSMSSRPSGP
jgi:hypothetical protein